MFTSFVDAHIVEKKTFLTIHKSNTLNVKVETWRDYHL